MTEDPVRYGSRRLNVELVMQELFQELGGRREAAIQRAAAAKAAADASLWDLRTQMYAEYFRATLELRVIASAQRHLVSAWSALRRLRDLEDVDDTNSRAVRVDPGRTVDVIAQIGQVVGYAGEAWLVERIRAVERPQRSTLVVLRRVDPRPVGPVEDLAGTTGVDGFRDRRRPAQQVEPTVADAQFDQSG